MHRQVGAARPDPDGLVRRGLMIRHLVMPQGLAGTKAVVDWVAANLSVHTWITLMSQYQPPPAVGHSRISRRVTRAEFSDAIRWAQQAGLTNLDIQPLPT